MLKVLEIKNNFVEGGKKLCDIYADSKDEVKPGAFVEGLGDISILATASTCLTSNLDVGLLKSDGTQTWL